MKPIVTYALFGLGGLTLFGGAFVVSSALSGTPLYEVAFLKNFVRAPVEPEETDGPPDHESTSEELADTHDEPKPAHDTHAPATKRDLLAVEANIGVLGSFLLPSPMSATELGELQSQLRHMVEDVRGRLARIEERERKLTEWESSLEARFAEISQMRQLLERHELELSMREEEAKRDEDAKNARETQSWKELAKFFEEGEPGDLAKRLAQFEPKDAVRILLALDDERASALVNALPPEKYHAYLEAYRGEIRKP